MKKIVLLYLLLASINASDTFGQENKIVTSKVMNKVVYQYAKAEWDILITAEFANAYLQEEISLDMVITSPTGKKLTLPCYFERGKSNETSLWKARFTPQEVGNYAYKFQLNKQERPVASSVKKTFSSKKGTGKGILHAKNDWGFQFDNGEFFRGIGENLCWESRANDDSKFFKALHEKPKYNYEYMLRSLASHGGNYYRTWICSWNLPLDWNSNFNNSRYTKSDEYFNPSAIKKLDRMIDLSDSLGLYVMLTLGPGSYDERNGRYATSTANFFVDEKAKQQYRNRLRFIVARWGYSNAIGAWEFFNEIDNVQFRDRNNPIDPAAIVQWHDEMSAYIKKIDPFKHLVTTSISHRDLKGLNSIANIDFNQKHIYKNNKALPTTIVSYTNQFKKPYVIGEFGYEYDWSKDFNLFADEMDSDFKRGLWYGLFTPTPILPLSWWWEYFDDRGTDAYIARVRKVQDMMMKAGRGSFLIHKAVASSAQLELYSVKCGVETYIYVYNPTKETIKASVNTQVKSTAPTLQVYTCETGALSSPRKMKSVSKQLKINDITLAANADLVLIIK